MASGLVDTESTGHLVFGKKVSDLDVLPCINMLWQTVCVEKYDSIVVLCLRLDSSSLVRLLPFKAGQLEMANSTERNVIGLVIEIVHY